MNKGNVFYPHYNANKINFLGISLFFKTIIVWGSLLAY